jgi:hypothetical protein
MSSITPPSFVDDGNSFQKRIPHRPHPSHIASWIDSTGSDTSTYTGSFVDDGADLLRPQHHAPGFGPIDPRFYKQRKRKDAKEGVWNDDIQRAVVGDMQRSLAKMREIANVEMKRPGGEEKRGNKDTVTVPVPPRWGTFVIKGDGGRVVVVGEDGEFDSGVRGVDEREQGRWVKGQSIITSLALPSAKTGTSKEHSRDIGKRSSRRTKTNDAQTLSPSKALTPVPESEYEDGDQPSAGEDLASPTAFFMTGGASGWPSRAPTSVASPAQAERSSKHPSTASPVKPASPTNSPPGAWPSPVHSPTRYSSAFERSSTKKSSVKSWGEGHSHGSEISQNSRKRDSENVSLRSHSMYKPPIVEDAAYTSSSEILKASGDLGWGGSQTTRASHRVGSNKGSDHSYSKKSEQPWGGSHKSSRRNAQDGPWPTPPNPTIPFTTPASLQNWIGERVKTVSSSSDTSTRRSRSHGSHSRAPTKQYWHADDQASEATWDGYERPKTLSEVSVVGTGSERSWSGSRAASHRSRRSHGSHRSSKHSHQQEPWVGSEQSWAQSQKANVDGWGGEETEGEVGWSGSQGGEGGRLSQGYDEHNETYQDGDWSGAKVRVGKRRERVGGLWD